MSNKVSEYTVALAGNPNVGKSTVFNSLTGLKQHTGNWPGKTVITATGSHRHKDGEFTIVDLPGTYSLIATSQEEEVARDFICSGKANVTVVVVDATCLERNLNLVLQTLEITNHVVVCVNLIDEASRKQIKINLKKLSSLLGVPVVATNARSNEGLDELMDVVYRVAKGEVFLDPISLAYDKEAEEIVTKVKKAEEIASQVVTFKNKAYNQRDRQIDQVLTSKALGIPIMLGVLGIIFWITIVGANYPSDLIANFLFWLEGHLMKALVYLRLPSLIREVLVLGVYRTLAWVIAVMLPPMAIFFPLFTFLEDLGYLPRVAFNLDHFFKKASAHGKQALTMCMGFGCNCAGVIGCRIIDSPREKLIAIITNNFTPCNGRFPTLIAISTIFIGGVVGGFYGSFLSTLAVIGIVVLGILMTLLISNLLSKTILKGVPSSFTLELPPYRRPQVGRIIVRSILDRTLYVLGRAILVAAPAGLVIWILANFYVGGMSLLSHSAQFLDPFAHAIGLDGYILMAFILGFPANEIVIPIIIMSYLSEGSLLELNSVYALGELLIKNGWTAVTALSVMIFTLMHYPCGTSLLTIYKETKSAKWTLVSFLVPTISGIVLCFLVTQILRWI